MQLNNLVIIPIPYSTQNALNTPETEPLSPTKVLSRSVSLKDDISWKRSLSAFKRFKGKKDKDTKPNKNSQSNIPFLEEEQPNPTPSINFSLVENHIKFSLLNNQDYEQIKIEDTLDYFDPNKAPFFQFGVVYEFSQLDVKTQANQDDQEPLKLTKKSSSTPRLKKELSRRQKSKSINPDQNLNIKMQKSHSQQNLNSNEPRQETDPFIILKAPEIREKQSSSSQSKSQLKKCDDTKKSKHIKKRSKYSSVCSSMYHRDIYSRPRSEDFNDPQSEQNDERSLGYGNDELPMIEFDFGIPIKLQQQVQNQNGTDNLPIYEIKDTSVVRSRIRPFINSTEILQEYQFNPEFIDGEGTIQQKEVIQISNHEGLEKA